MSPRPVSPPSDQTAAFDQGGCLSGFLIPPLAVLLVGALLVLLWFDSGAAAASPAPLALAENSLPPSPAVVQDMGVQPQGSVSTIFQAPVQYWAQAILRWASSNGLDPNLVATVMQIESCGDPAARSSAGAIGLFQVMPFHFTGSDDPFLPDVNAARGLAYLGRALQAAGGDARLALAGYNGGIGVIGRPEILWPAETQRYVYWGSGIYADASAGTSESLRMQEWLVTSGASLCRQAGLRLGLNP
jgi:hypothetical protein